MYGMITQLIRHCFSCGNLAVVRFVDGRERYMCGVCEQVIYQNPSPAAAVMLVQAGRVLLVKRGVEPQKGRWGLPAGFQELDETPEQAARREMHEETGLMPGKLQLFDLAFNNHNPHKPVNVAIFMAQEAEGALQPGDDVAEVNFFPIHQLPTDLAFHYIHDCLRRLPFPSSIA